MFSIIACIGKNRELGKNGGLVFHLKEDMKFFKEKTLGHKVIMGRKTWESLPGKLPERQNIVVSSHSEIEGADETVSDLPAFIRDNIASEEEIFVIGGAKIYEQFINFAEKMYLTEVKVDVAGTDTFFPIFDKNNWRKEILGKGQENGLEFQFVCYHKNN